MIIWINGAFGAGKTTIATRLNEEIPGSFLYDPENVGYLFKYNLPEAIQKNDFQDYPEWRQWNVQILKRLVADYQGDIIAPMTLFNPKYFDEIIGELRREKIPICHFQLEVRKDVIINRLQERNATQIEWATSKLEAILAGFEKIPVEEKINNDNRALTDVIAEIIKKVDLSRSVA